MKLNVPYYSQYSDVNDSYWSPRACGFCCFKMVAEYHGAQIEPVIVLAEGAEKEGGYSEHGIIHDYVLKLAREKRLLAHREEKMDTQKGIEKIVLFLKEKNPVTVSFEKNYDGKKLFHQVVVVGYEEDGGGLLGFYIHDSAYSQRDKGKFVFVDLDDFLSEWRRMAIFISK